MGHKGTAFSDLPTTAQEVKPPEGHQMDGSAPGADKRYSVDADAIMASGNVGSAESGLTPSIIPLRKAASIAGPGQKIANWPTPSANEDAAGTEKGNMQFMLSHAALKCGSEANGSTAATGKGGVYRLNPAFSLWLMGYPAEWLSCGVRVMQSCRKSRQSSSGPFLKAKRQS